jgi:quinol monooxygenase YgiN
MIIRIVKMTFAPQHVADFEQLFDRIKTQIRNFPGCMHLELLADLDNPNVFFTYSHWRSKEDLEKYRHSTLFAEVWPRTKVLFGDKPEAWSITQKHILA